MLSVSGSLIEQLKSNVSKEVNSRAMVTVIDEEESSNETIDLVTEDIGFTAGTLAVQGSYKVFAQEDDTDVKMTLSVDANVETNLTNAVTQDYDGYVFHLSGKANADIIGDLKLAGEGISPNQTMKFDLDYGVAFSLGMIISVDGPTASDDVGAIVLINLKMANSNHKTYYEADYSEEENVFEDIINDSLPTNASLEISVYNNDRNIIFTKTYTQAEIQELL